MSKRLEWQIIFKKCIEFYGKDYIDNFVCDKNINNTIESTLALIKLDVNGSRIPGKPHGRLTTPLKLDQECSSGENKNGIMYDGACQKFKDSNLYYCYYNGTTKPTEKDELKITTYNNQMGAEDEYDERVKFEECRKHPSWDHCPNMPVHYNYFNANNTLPPLTNMGVVYTPPSDV